MRLKMTTAEKSILILIILTIAFIWINSMLPGATSTEESGFVMKVITPLLEIAVGKGNVTMHLVRKLAHFTEYFVLGAELAIYAAISSVLKKLRKKWLLIVLPLACGLLVAAIDETIQIFASSRGPSVQDVILDFTGVCMAVLIVSLITAIIDFGKTYLKNDQ